jgi:hypothetical protein
MKPYRKFKPVQIRWKEAMGNKECPYLYRWSFIFFGWSIRIHHWIKSDDKRFFHDHPGDLISFVIKGRYANVTPKGRVEVKAPFIWKSKAEDRHYLEIPKEGAWTILLFWPKRRNWGFWITDTHMLRPLEYFHRYGIIQDKDYQ